MYRHTATQVMVVALAACFSSFPAGPAKARTLLVDASGGGDYLLVSEAVAAASSGDTVAIRPGTYDEYDGTSYHIRRDSTSINIIGLGEPQDVRLRLSMEFLDCSVVLRNLTFYGEHNPIFMHGLSNALEAMDCVFEENTSFIPGAAVYASGVTFRFEDCAFRNNTVDAGEYGDGGAVSISAASCSFRACTFTDNSCTRSGGALYSTANEDTVDNCVFIANTAYNGGALKGVNPTIRGCSFWRNRTTWDSGAALEIAGYHADVENCIIAGTLNGYGIGCWDAATTFCCCYWANERGPNTSGCAVIPGYGNIEVDPLFCDPANDDLTLSADSPCLPGEHGGWTCELIGAFGEGCGDTPTENTSWGRIKHRFLNGK